MILLLVLLSLLFAPVYFNEEVIYIMFYEFKFKKDVALDIGLVLDLLKPFEDLGVFRDLLVGD